jgi:predicted outer membrane repeat protein
MDSNYAYEFGGGCNLEVGGSVIINNTVFSRNRAGSSGGGIRARERLDLSNVLFDSNYAVRQGKSFDSTRLHHVGIITLPCIYFYDG